MLNHKSEVDKDIKYKELEKRIQDLENLIETKNRLFGVVNDFFSDAFFVIDNHSIVSECNTAFLKLTNKDKNQVIGYALQNIIPHRFAEVFEKANDDLFAYGGGLTYEANIADNKGKTKEIIIKKKVVEGVSPNERKIACVISDNQSDEDNFHVNEATIRELTSASSDVIIKIDTELKHVYVSPSVKGLKSIEPENYINQKITAELYNLNISIKFNQELKKLFEENRHSEFTGQLKHKNTEKILNFILVPEITDNSNVDAALVIIKDITSRYKFEKELIEAKNKANTATELKSKFLNNLSHEIRTPLNGIIGFAHLLRQEELPSERRQNYVDMLNQSCSRLLSMINNIVDISKIQTETVQIYNTPFSINSFLSELYEKTVEILKQKGHDKIEVTTKNKVRKNYHSIIADRDKIEQVFSHLISNAVKFTSEGSIEIGCIQKDANNILFYIKDTGIGIPLEKQKVIFDEFRQAEEGDGRSFSGTGLGLSIAKGFVEAMGGKINCSSEKNNGATFFFTIPFNVDTQGEVKIQKEETIDALHKLKGRNILIVEDDEINLRFLLEVLSAYDVNTFIAKDGEHALSVFFSNTDIELILLDIQLPNISGYDVVRQIRKTNKNLPVIAQTAHAMLDDRYKALEVGCTDYITKPIDSKLLAKMLCKYL